MDLAIIISVHNRNDLRLRNSLQTFLYQETSHSYEIYVVDYASSDNLRTMLQELGSDKILYLSVDDNIGKPRANNIAIRATEADIICSTDGYCIAPMQTVENICTQTKEDTLLLYAKHPYIVPEPVWQDPNLTPIDYEYLRQQATEWLGQEMQIGTGFNKKPLFAVKRQRLLEINGYDETLEDDEDVDIVRRLLQHGCVLADLSESIDIAYQPLTSDLIGKSAKGLQQQRDAIMSDASASLRRSDPVRNIGIEWGQI